MAILSRSIAQRNNNHLETTKSEKNVDSVASSVSPFSNHLLSFSRLGLESFTYHLRDREYLKLLILYYLRTRCSNEASPFIRNRHILIFEPQRIEKRFLFGELVAIANYCRLESKLKARRVISGKFHYCLFPLSRLFRFVDASSFCPQLNSTSRYSQTLQA